MPFSNTLHHPRTFVLRFAKTAQLAALLVKPVIIACFLGIVRNKWHSALSLTAFAGRQEEDTGKARNAERNASGMDSCKIKFGHFWQSKELR
jgi:hypothetical protein